MTWIDLTRKVLPVLAAAGLSWSCGSGDSGTGPGGGGALAFETSRINLRETRATAVVLKNGTSAPLGPIRFRSSAVLDATGVDVGGVMLTTFPRQITSLQPGEERTISLSIRLTGLPPGGYEVQVDARIDDTPRATVGLTFDVLEGTGSSAATVRITDGPAQIRQGDPSTYTAEARNDRAELLPPAFLKWFVLPTFAGDIDRNGLFVPYVPGAARILVRSGAHLDTLAITITPRGATGSLTLAGQTATPGRNVTRLWTHGDYAYVGTEPGAATRGDALLTWDISDPAQPVLTGELVVDANQIGGVHVRADGILGVLGHRGSSDGLNGVTLLDMTDPAQPEVLSRFTDGLEAGVMAVRLEGDFLYVAAEGGTGDLRILDVSDPAAPVEVADFYGGVSFLSDIVVQDGVAVLAHWNAGLMILDVGGAGAGGSPAAPVELGRTGSEGGQASSLVYWPEGGYAFVSEEDFSDAGALHVMDVSDLANPIEVATFTFEEGPPARAWIDREREILYVAWRESGVRGIDVSGRLLGDLDLQGRAPAVYAGVGGTMSAAVQLHRGMLFVADGGTGLVVLRPQ